MRESNCQPLRSKKGMSDNLPSTRFVEEVLKSLPWLSTGKYNYGHYFSCDKCTQWDMTYRVFRKNVLDKLDLLEQESQSELELTTRIRRMLPLSSKTFALSLLCEAKPLSENEYKTYPFRRKCWFNSCDICVKTGKKCSHQNFFCSCAFNKFSTFLKNVLFLFVQKDTSVLYNGKKIKLQSASMFAFFDTKSGFRQPDPTKDPFVFPVVVKSLLKAKQFVVLVDKFLVVFIPHLLYLNWTATQLKSITDQENPRLPVGDILVGFDFSQSPSFMKSGMGQRHYQQNQIFGLLSFIFY